MHLRDQRGSAVVDFVLVMVVLVPLVLGIIQVGLVMHVARPSRRRPRRVLAWPRPWTVVPATASR